MVLALVLGAIQPALPLVETRTLTLPNGMRIVAERMPNVRLVTLNLSATSFGCEDTPPTQGRRHLLEHLAARGPSGTLDARLESEGIVLLASTSRDLMEFSMTVRPRHVGLGLGAFSEVLQPLKLTPDVLAKELKILGHELSLAETARRLSARGWTRTYGTERLDTAGNLVALSKLSAEHMAAFQVRQFDPTRLVLCASGDLDPESFLERAKAEFGHLEKKDTPLPEAEGVFPPAVPAQTGTARMLNVSGISTRETWADIAVGKMLAARLPETQFVYTVSTLPGLMFLASTDRDVFATLGEYFGGQFANGRLALKSTVADFTESPVGRTSFRAALMQGRPEADFDSVLKIPDTLEPADFAASLKRWQLARDVAE